MEQLSKTAHKEKFSTQINVDILSALRGISDKEGRKLQALVEEALLLLIEKRAQVKTRSHVMDAYQSSHQEYASLYEKLAK